MGYDCYVRTADGIDHNDDDLYFRRSIFGGAPLTDALVGMEMGFDPATYGLHPPDWPDAAEYGVVFNEWRDDSGQWHSDWKGDRAAEYEAAMNDVLDWHGVSDIPGIPTHKVCTSNDGWHVTQLECVAALGIYRMQREKGVPHPEEFYDDFIPFLEQAARHDGFEVH